MPQVTAEGSTHAFDRPPDTCPICHHAIEPRLLTGTLSAAHGPRDTVLDVAFKCTRPACARMFIGRYSADSDHRGILTGAYSLRGAVPVSPTPPTIAEEVKAVSPAFVEIYTQASAAEAYGLSQIAGVGFRKALEFLVKDYCVSKTPEAAEPIKTKMLGRCIADHVTDANIKVCAQRAAWLGNDETHYVRKWEDKDILDLKVLLELTMNWIRNEALTKRYLESMPGA